MTETNLVSPTTSPASCNPPPPKTEPALDKADLENFTGSEHWYRHPLVRYVRFTDGAKYVADRAAAYWLLDEIALAQQFIKAVATEEFQVWKLSVNPDHTATLSCEDGNYNTVFTKPIEFTDFPLDESPSGMRTTRSICQTNADSPTAPDGRTPFRSTPRSPALRRAFAFLETF